MLFPNRLSTLEIVYDNASAGPGSTPGISWTPGGSDADGGWQTLTSVATTQDIYALHFRFHSAAGAGADSSETFDFGVDPSGGTSPTAVISDVQSGGCGATTAAGTSEFFFWIYIPAGSKFFIRGASTLASPAARSVAVRGYGQPSRPELVPRGTFSETFGSSGSSGTSITPGNAADGSWVSLGTTVNEMWWWQCRAIVANATRTAEYTYIEFAYGDGSNKVTITKHMILGTTSEVTAMTNNVAMIEGFKHVPAGSTIYVRARCNNAPDTGYEAMAVGIGG